MSPLTRPAALMLAALAIPAAALASNPDGFTCEFPIASCDFNTTGGNGYLKSRVNRQLYLSNSACAECVPEDGLVELWITILPDRAYPQGSRYFQKYAVNAKDRVEHTSMGFEVEVPAETFRQCVKTTETTPLEPGAESLALKGTVTFKGDRPL